MSNVKVTIKIEASKKGIIRGNTSSYQQYLAGKEQGVDTVQLMAQDLIKQLDQMFPEAEQKQGE